MLLCCDCSCKLIKESTSGPDWMTIIIAVATVLVTIYVVYLGKKVDIKLDKFKKLCFEPLESKFQFLTDYMEQNKNDSINNHLNPITEIVTDFNLILVQIKTIYPKLDVNVLQNLFIEFTDEAYRNPSNMMYSIYGDLLRTKVRIFEKVYNYALDKELKVFNF